MNKGILGSNYSRKDNHYKERQLRLKPVTLRNDYAYSYNGKIINKNCPDKQEYNKFTSYDSSAYELIDIIKRGYAFSPSVFKNSERKQNNFIKADIVALDIDNAKLDNEGNKVYDPQLSLESAIENEFIKRHGLLYTSPSHSDNWHRFRLIFFLPVTVDNGETLTELLKIINEILGGVADSNCLECARLFYGNDNAQWFNTDLNQVYELPYELVLKARENVVKILEEKEAKKKERQANQTQYEDIGTAELMRNINLLGYVPPRSKGSNTYDMYRALVWGLCSLAPDNEDFLSEISFTLDSLGIFSGTEKHYPEKLVREFDKDRGINFASFIFAYEKLTGEKYPHLISKRIIDGFSKFQQWLIKGFNSLSKGFMKGFKEVVVKVPDLNPNIIYYSPDMELPVPSDYEEGLIPEFIVPRKYKGHKAKLKAKLIGIGWVLHDMSFVGDGKSHDVTKLGNVLYLDTNYKNPSIKEIEKMPVMPSRLQYGLFDVNGKLKADPENRSKYQQVSPSNCHFKPLFRALEDKGYDVESNNTICGKCPHNKQCGLVIETGGFGFKGERKEAIAKMKISGTGRAHYKQIHGEMLTGDNAVFDRFTLVFEEAGQVNLKQSISANVDDIDKVISQITRIKFNEDTDKVIGVDIEFRKDIIIDFLNELRDVLVNAYEIFSKGSNGKFYGLTKEDILNILTVPELTQNEIFLLQNEFDLDIDKVIPDFVGIDRNGLNDKEKRQARNAEKYLKDEQNEQIKANLEKLSNNWFSQLLNILFGYQQGTFRVTKDNQLEVITVDNHHQKLAAAAHGLLLLDATKSTRQLKAIYGIYKPMLTFRVELPVLNNLRVVNVNMTGLGSNNWSDYTLERVSALKQELTVLHNDNIAFLSPKKFTEKLGNNYYFGKDDRGSNELMNYEAIAHLGKPMPNLGEARIIYDLFINVDNYSFEEYYLDLVRESQIQGLGRSRVQHSPDKTFTHYFVGTNQDMSFLSAYGINVENVNVIDICENAGSKGDRTKKVILESAKALYANGEKLTQKAIAEMGNMSQQLVSKAFKGSCLGWKKFKNLLLSLYKEHKEKVVKNNNDLDSLDMWLECPSSQALEEIARDIVKHGTGAIIKLATELNASLHSCYRLLWLIAPLFDERLLEMREKITQEVG